MDILIIEPDRILSKQYKKVFEEFGMTVRLCPDAQKAILMIDEHQPDAIVLEMQLAGHSGVEFLQEFRSYEDWATIPVFIYSRVPEYALGANQKIWTSFGVVRYLYKPQTSLEQLIGAVRGILLA